MDKYVTLIGTEDVRNAASTMRAAAEEMNRAASNIREALWQHERFLTEWLVEFKTAMEHANPEPEVMKPLAKSKLRELYETPEFQKAWKEAQDEEGRQS